MIVEELERFEAEDGRRLAFLDTGGSGPVVLCLAGLTRNHRDFLPLIERFSPRYRMVALDYRGRGASEHAADPIAEYTVPVESRDALALLGHLGITRTALIGTSRGGIIGMGLAAAVPGLLSALVLNDVGAVIDAAGLLRIMSYIGREPSARSFAEAAKALQTMEADRFPGVPLERWEAHARAMFVEEGGRLRLSYDHHLAAAVAAAMEGDVDHVSLWPLFEATHDVPVLCLRGANSDILSADTLAEMARHHPQFTAVTVPDRGHAPFLDERDAVQAIESFLETHA